MTTTEYAEIKINYHILLLKITHLKIMIQATHCPVKLALFNSDMRDLLDQKESVLNFIICQINAD